MVQSGVSVTLTIYHDGQFWVGLFERLDDSGLRACRVVFGAAPSNEEILDLIGHGWERRHFSDAVDAQQPRGAGNPKRRQREAAKALHDGGPSTKVYQALSQQREVSKAAHAAASREARAARERERYAKRTEKRKNRRRGH